MPRRCTACSHADLAAIDVALVEGSALRDIARRFGLSKDSVGRHKAEHLAATVVRAKEIETVANADDLLGKVRALEAEARRIATKAEASGDLRTALSGVRELSRIVELQARLLGELNESARVEVAVSTEWEPLRAAILVALDAHPEARRSVSEALAGIRTGG